MEEIIKLVNEEFNGEVTDIYFIKRDKLGNVECITPAIITKKPSIQLVVSRLLSTGDALRSMAQDMINKTLGKN
jgi:type IV secretory pathway TrbF-like protein